MNPSIVAAQIKDHRDKIALTLFNFIRDLDQTPDAELHVHMRERNLKLLDWLQEEDRLLRYLAGEKVEPKELSVHVVAHGVGGAAL